MFAIFVCSLFLSATIDVAYGNYQRVSHGWISQHKVVTTWDKAYKQCQREGAVLASPTTSELRDKMQSLIGGNTMYFTGTKATYNSDIFVSIEGVLLNNMPVLDLFEQLDSEDGRCLTMNSNNISVAACSSRMPYMCYKKQIENTSRTVCGTYDKDYKFAKITGSCFKFHSSKVNWHEAYATCIAEGGHLAIINDITEAKYIVKDVVTKRELFVWCGLTDWEKTNNWKSIHGQPIDELYRDWITEPKSNGLAICAAINPVITNEKLKSFECDSTTLHFLCERDPAHIQYKGDIYEA